MIFTAVNQQDEIIAYLPLYPGGAFPIATTI
jgi:hypothetical protein